MLNSVFHWSFQQLQCRWREDGDVLSSTLFPLLRLRPQRKQQKEENNRKKKKRQRERRQLSVSGSAPSTHSQSPVSRLISHLHPPLQHLLNLSEDLLGNHTSGGSSAERELDAAVNHRHCNYPADSLEWDVTSHWMLIQLCQVWTTERPRLIIKSSSLLLFQNQNQINLLGCRAPRESVWIKRVIIILYNV